MPLIGPRRTVLSGGAEFQPIDIEDCQLWYKAEQLSGSIGSAVATWPNSGVAGVGENATGVNSPTLEQVTNGSKTFKVVRFDGVNQHFTIPDFDYNRTSLTVFAVVKNDNVAPASDEAVFSHWDTNSLRSWLVLQTALRRESWGTDTVGDGTGRKFWEAGHTQNTEWILISGVFDASGSTPITVNGLLQNPIKVEDDAQGASLFNSTASLTIAASLSSGIATTILDGDIAELVMFDRNLDADETARMYEYLSSEHDISRQGGSLFNPTKIDGLDAWYNVEQGGEDFNAASDPVAAWSSWHDEGTTDVRMIQGIGSKQPRILLNQQNGRPGIYFDNGDHTLYALSGDFTETEGTIVYVAEFADSATSAIIASSDDAANNDHFTAQISSDLPQVVSRVSGSNDNVTVTNSVNVDTPMLVVLRSDGSVWTIELNGVVEDLIISDGANTGEWFGDVPNRDNLTLGAVIRTTDSLIMNGTLYEAFIYNRKLTDGEVLNLVSWLNARWSVF